MKLTACIFYMMVVAICFGENIKNITSAKHTSILATESSSTYVMDGLVAWFDAEWNAGIQLHDDNATAWNNLADGAQHQVTIASGAWRSNAIALSNGSLYVDVTQQMLEAIRAGKFTVEVVTSTSLGDAGWQAQTINIAASLSDGYNKGICALMRNELTGQVAAPYMGTGSYGAGTSYTPSTKDSLVTAALLYNGERGYVFANGVMTDKNGTSIQPNSSISGVFLRIPSRSYAFRGYYHCFRIYNRTLSTSELAHNYAIDKERFGLQ